jgi:hypothetical protein
VTSLGFSPHAIGWVAIAVAGVSLLGAVFLGLLFVVGQPFGTLNDVLIAFAAVLSGLLAWMIYSGFRSPSPQIWPLALLAALAGAVIVTIGSVLVISGTTGWYLAGLFMMAGNALIGLWLLGISSFARGTGAWPNGLVILGVVAGAIMAVGLLTVPGIVRGIDAWEAAPWVVNLGQVSALGWILVYPAWCFWLGRFLLSR